MLIICEYTLKSNEIACKVTIFFEHTQVYINFYVKKTFLFVYVTYLLYLCTRFYRERNIYLTYLVNTKAFVSVLSRDVYFFLRHNDRNISDLLTTIFN
jgi:hypothetical protein